MSLLLLLLHYWFRLLLLFPWKQILGKQKQGKGFKILTLKSVAYSVSVGSCCIEQEWIYSANPPLFGIMPVATAAWAPERSLLCPLALFAYIFLNHNCIIKKRERKAHGKIAKDNIGVQELYITFICSMSKTYLSVTQVSRSLKYAL